DALPISFCTQCLKSACLVFILKITFLKVLKCTVAKPLICCSCFCNKQLNKNVKCGKEYFTLNVSNIVLFIFKSFITFCWGKKEEKKKSHIKSQSQYFGKKSQLDYFPKSFSPSVYVRVQECVCVCKRVCVCVCACVCVRARVKECVGW